MAEQTLRNPKIPVEIRVMFDYEHYRCELRESGQFFKAIDGDFLEEDRGLGGRIKKLTEVMSDGLSHLVAIGTGDITHYSVHSSFQPVADIYEDNVTTR